MEYKKMLMDAKEAGISTEKVMWQSVDSLNTMLCKLKEEHPDMYMKFVREQQGIIYGNHYDKQFAEYDVEPCATPTRTAASARERTGRWSR